MRLLIIDDEQDICEIIAEIAEARGFEVATLSDPSLVAEKLTSFAPQAIMLDLMMPGTDGVELLRMMVDRVKTIKICLMSGSDARVLNSARRLGSAHGLDVVAAMEKPIDIATLRATLDQLMGSEQPLANSSIATALSQGQFILHYQPVVALATRMVKGVEALIRWDHPVHGILQPSEFLDQIASEGLMLPLTEHVITTAIAQAAKWQAMGENLTLSFNLTASSLIELNLPDRLAGLCAQKNLPPERLVVEVTETEAMHDITRTMDVLLRLRLRNFGISIDDFGTGHSTLRQLQRMPFSEMKIDQSFIADMATNKDSEVIVNSTIDLGHNLGLKIIAEGVETERVWTMLAEKKCDYAQGYFMSKAMPADEFHRWLTGWRNSAS